MLVYQRVPFTRFFNKLPYHSINSPRKSQEIPSTYLNSRTKSCWNIPMYIVESPKTCVCTPRCLFKGRTSVEFKKIINHHIYRWYPPYIYIYIYIYIYVYVYISTNSFNEEKWNICSVWWSPSLQWTFRPWQSQAIKQWFSIVFCMFTRPGHQPNPCRPWVPPLPGGRCARCSSPLGNARRPSDALEKKRDMPPGSPPYLYVCIYIWYVYM